MPGTMAKLIRPTGFEGEQERAKRLRDLADTMNQLSLSTQPVQSWAQVLARVLQGYVAGRSNRKADALTDDVTKRMTDAFTSAHTGFQADVKAGMTPDQLVAKWGGNPYESDDLTPYQQAMAAGLKKHAENGETYVKTTDKGYQPMMSEVGRVDYDPNATVNTSDNGKTYAINPVKITADRLAQGTGPAINAVTSMPGPGQGAPVNPSAGAPNADPLAPMPAPAPYYPANTGGTGAFIPSNIAVQESGGHDFKPNGAPVVSKKGAMYGMQVMPSTAADPGYGVRPVSPAILNLPATDPRRAAEFNRLGADYAAAMQRKFGNTQLAAAAYNGGPGRMEAAGSLANMPSESQTYASHFSGPPTPPKPPSGVAGGKPYWLINGVPYDNPEGN